MKSVILEPILLFNPRWRQVVRSLHLKQETTFTVFYHIPSILSLWCVCIKFIFRQLKLRRDWLGNGKKDRKKRAITKLTGSVADPDLHVFGPSGSTSQKYGSGSGSCSGSGSFYHHAKIVRKTLIPTILWLFLTFFSLKNDVNVASKSNQQKNCVKKLVFCWHLEGQWRK